MNIGTENDYYITLVYLILVHTWVIYQWCLKCRCSA